MSRLYTITEAEEALRLSRSTIVRLVGRGELRTITIGRSRRITEDELQRFVRSREDEAAAARA